MKKIKLILKTFLFTLIISFLIFIVFFKAKENVIIKSKKGNYYDIHSWRVIGNNIIAFANKKSYNSKKQLIDSISQNKASYGFKVISFKAIERIELFTKKSVSNEITRTSVLGIYRLTASGHRGILRLYSRKNRSYGYIRFPHWAKGVAEPLKYLRIKGNKISFIRSVTTKKELQRVGANFYFTQRYYGTFNKNKTFISGFYTSRGAKSIWEARKK